MASSSLDAVVKIESIDGNLIHRGSGVLLSGGVYILTAAHLFNHDPSNSSITLSNKTHTLPSVKSVYLYPGWDKTNTANNHDIAIVELSSPATSVQGLELWQGSNPIGQQITLAGFGAGKVLSSGTNILDGYGELFNQIFARGVAEGSQLLYDHDNGSSEQNTLGSLFNLGSATPTTNEKTPVQGDSGGPLLIDDQVVGVASYVFRSDTYDINDSVDGSPGEVAGATAVTPYIPWINSVAKSNQIPTTKDQVITEIFEPSQDLAVNYFLLEMSTARKEIVSLQYTTRNGTATAGEDYVAVSGTVALQPGETQIAIPVTIYGDTTSESNETLNMVISDSTGTWIGIGVEIIASHTIVNNDFIG